MPNLLISGPAGAGKSQEARRLLEELRGHGVVVDFQAIYAMLLGLERLPNGRYPARRAQDAYVLALAEYVRRAIILGAVEQEIDVIATNSDGSPDRRLFLLGLLGPDSRERILDPGFDVVTERLSNPDGTLDEQCVEARDRWYSRRV